MAVPTSSSHPGMSKTVKAYAKVNLHLGVGRLREDGYHDLVTVFQQLSIHDDVTLRLLELPQSRAGAGVSLDDIVSGLTVTGPYSAGVPTDERNLAWRALQATVARLLAAASEVSLSGTSVPIPAAVIELHKGIPAAGGMAGGSADAAAVIKLANELYAAALSVPQLAPEQLLAIGAELGSDIPFGLVGGTALGTGRGENLVPMLSRGSFHWAIITSATGLATPEVFRKLDELRGAGPDGAGLDGAGPDGAGPDGAGPDGAGLDGVGPDGAGPDGAGPESGRRLALQPHLNTDAVARALISGDPHQLGTALHNDLQPATLSLRPDIRKTLEVGRAAGALGAIVSGSGPTCAFLAGSADDALDLAHSISVELPGTRGLVASS